MNQIPVKKGDRVESDWATYQRCGRCDLRHMTYDATLNLKRNTVQSLINKESNEFVVDSLVGSRKITRAKINRFEEEGGYTLGSEAEAYFVIKDLEYLIASVPSFSEFIN